jgi:hypothetical protein
MRVDTAMFLRPRAANARGAKLRPLLRRADGLEARTGERK